MGSRTSREPGQIEQQEGTRWYAVHTRSNFEKKVAIGLAEKGLESYLPVCNEIHQWKDRKKVVELPVFPNYVFARCGDHASEKLQILRTGGVVRILGSANGTAEPVPDAEIEAIRLMLASSGRCYRQPRLQEGARVRVSRGPLKGIEGSLLRVKNEFRLLVAISLLSQSVATEVDIGDIDPIPAAGESNRSTSAN